MILAKLAMCLFCAFVVTTFAAGQTENVLHSFGSGADGADPYAQLIADKTGSLYGTTESGGTCCGTVFQLTPPAKKGDPWTYAVIYNFQQDPDGKRPVGGLVLDKMGNLYGTTGQGGSSNDGTVFELSPPLEQGTDWTESVIYSFEGGSDGATPFGTLIFDGAALIGTTFGGGSADAGTVFELKKVGSSWAETRLYTFTGGGDGGNPDPGVTLYKGVLYGTTKAGGICCGTVFSLTLPKKGSGVETVLHAFTGGDDGYTPQGNVIFDKTGLLYSTTESGGANGFGTVFELTPPAKNGEEWVETVLHSFTANGVDGVNPVAGLVFDSKGNLYGTTFGGGEYLLGTMFQLSPPAGKGDPWNETIVHSFGDSGDGVHPEAGLLFYKNEFFGSTYSGGEFNLGSVFESAK